MHSDNLAHKIAGQMRDLLTHENSFKDSFLSARQAAEKFNCSRQTANNALNILAKEGLLTRKNGSGTFVNIRQKKLHIACVISEELTNSTPSGLYKKMLINKLLQQELANNDCECKLFSFEDLQRSNFSPRLFDKFDGLIVHESFTDKNSRQLINDFAKPKLWPWTRHVLHESGNQLVLDLMTPFSQIFRKARFSGIRKCYLHYFDENFLQIMQNAMLYSNFESADQQVLQYRSAFEIAAYKNGLNLEYAPDVLHVCQADAIAWGLFEAFTDRGAQLGDFHVTGCGDNESLGVYPLQYPRLTTINYQHALGIELSVKLLCQKIRENSLISEVIRIPGKVVYRESAFYEKKKTQYITME